MKHESVVDEREMADLERARAIFLAPENFSL